MDKFLQQFIEIATFKNVSHAAKKLCLSQPTLTHNMKKLEKELGVILFTRSSTGIELTESGEVLLEHTRMMQRIYDNALTKLELLKVRQERQLKMGCGDAWWLLFVSDTVNTYRQRYPAANIHCELGNHLRLMDMLLSGDIDLFIGHEIAGLSRKAEVKFLPLFISTNKFFVRREHPLTFRECSLDDLVDYPHIEITPDESRYHHMVEDMQPKKLEKTLLHISDKVIYSSNSLMACIDLVNRTNGVMPYPGSTESYFRQFNLVPLNLADTQGRGTVGAYLLRERNNDAFINDMLALMRHYLEEKRNLLKLEA